MTSDSATFEPAVRSAAAPWRRLALGFACGLLVAAAFGATFLVGLRVAYAGRIMPGVSVAGLSLAGLDRATAVERLTAALPPLDRGSLTVRVAGETSRLSYAELGRRFDAGAIAEAASAVGRHGSLMAQAVDEVQALLRGTAVAPQATFDRAAVVSQVTAVVGSLQRPAIAAALVLPSGSSTFAVLPAIDGRRVDLEAALAQVEARLAAPDPGEATITLEPATIAPAVSTAAAQAAADQAARITAQPLALRIGAESFPVDGPTLASWLSFERGPGGDLVVRVSSQAVEASLIDLAARTDRPVRDATISWSVKGVSVVAAVEGRSLDVPASLAALMGALQAGPAGALPASVTLSATTTPPKVTTAQAQAATAKLQLLSTWTTYFVPGPGNYWGRNISIPTTQIDGTIVAPGAWFDFWKVVDVRASLGYGPGGAIIDGRTQETGALGGGICSCSTTLFNAALRAGLQMGARSNHYYYISRYPRGLDATVFKSDGGWTQTMSFRNDTPDPILIRGFNGPGRVTFQLYGVPTGRRVVLSAPIIKDYHRASDTVRITRSLPLGVRERVEYPADGFDAWVTRTVYDARGTIIHQETYYSHYATITGLTLVGGTPPAPTPTPAPSPSPTPPGTPAPSPSPAPSPNPSPSPS